MRLHLLRSLFIATTALIVTSHGQDADSCTSGFTFCAPVGATSETTPQIGSPAFQTLFVDIVLSSLPSSSKRSSSSSSLSASLCCRSLLSCLLMVDLEIPFCYDKFTTDYYLPDGSYGLVVCHIHSSRSFSVKIHGPSPTHNTDLVISGQRSIQLSNGRHGKLDIGPVHTRQRLNRQYILQHLPAKHRNASHAKPIHSLRYWLRNSRQRSRQRNHSHLHHHTCWKYESTIDHTPIHNPTTSDYRDHHHRDFDHNADFGFNGGDGVGRRSTVYCDPCRKYRVGNYDFGDDGSAACYCCYYDGGGSEEYDCIYHKHEEEWSK